MIIALKTAQLLWLWPIFIALPLFKLVWVFRGHIIKNVTNSHQSNQRPLKISTVQHLIRQCAFCRSVPNTDTLVRRLSGCYSNKDVCFQQGLRELC